MDDDDDDPVGYGKPPKKHQFQKGNQMARRRKGQARQSFEKMLNKKLHEKVKAVRNGRTVRITLLEALLERMVKLATSGSARDLISVLNYVRANLPEALASPGESGNGDPSDVCRAGSRQADPAGLSGASTRSPATAGIEAEAKIAREAAEMLQ